MSVVKRSGCVKKNIEHVLLEEEFAHACPTCKNKKEDDNEFFLKHELWKSIGPQKPTSHGHELVGGIIKTRARAFVPLKTHRVKGLMHGKFIKAQSAPVGVVRNRRSIAQELKIDHKTVLNHLRKVGLKKKLDVWVLHQLTPKNTMDRISICDSLAKRNEIDPFLKRMVTGDAKWVTYDNIVRNRSWSKCGEAAQTAAKPGLMSIKALLCIWWDWKGIIY
ncbi:histone-lysine N-methyltransferase SETMAR [Trichonephila clavipes]|nr:histone-lysine N-methyltransferase SETMAR [Trichonephila clavipes]